MSNFSLYIDKLIAWPPIDYDKAYWAQCVDAARAISVHLGYPITSYGNAWKIYEQGSKGYVKKQVGSYIPLPWDILFMKPAKSNWNAGHIAVADEWCTMSRYNVIHQNYWVQWASGSWVGDRKLKRQSMPAQQWAWILAREAPFQIKK